MDTVNINLYAQWTKAQYTIAYYGNGNNGGSVPPVTNYFYGTEIEIETPGSLQKIGHTFFKWNTDSFGNGVDYSPGAKITINGNMNFFARWKINEYTIVFNSRGGSLLNNQPVKYGDTVVIPSIPQKKSYVFDGWFEDSTCLKIWNFSINAICIEDTLFAKWIIKDVDGNNYTEVKIGNQVWMVENLKTTRYRDRSLIPQVKNNISWGSLVDSTPKYCWYNNDSANYCEYGALYNWYVVNPANPKKVAPEGWHVPNDEEWKELEEYCINNGYNWDNSTLGNKLGKSFATRIGWNPSSSEGAVGNNMETNNKTGFSAVASGYRFLDGYCKDYVSICYWWAIEEKDGIYGLYRFIGYDWDGVYYEFNDKRLGLSIRCIRD